MIYEAFSESLVYVTIKYAFDFNGVFLQKPCYLLSSSCQISRGCTEVVECL